MLILVDHIENDQPPTWSITLTENYKNVAVFEGFASKESAMNFLEKQMTRYGQKYAEIEVAFWCQEDRVFQRKIKYQGGVQV